MKTVLASRTVIRRHFYRKETLAGTSALKLTNGLGEPYGKPYYSGDIEGLTPCDLLVRRVPSLCMGLIGEMLPDLMTGSRPRSSHRWDRAQDGRF